MTDVSNPHGILAVAATAIIAPLSVRVRKEMQHALIVRRRPESHCGTMPIHMRPIRDGLNIRVPSFTRMNCDVQRCGSLCAQTTRPVSIATSASSALLVASHDSSISGTGA